MPRLRPLLPLVCAALVGCGGDDTEPTTTSTARGVECPAFGSVPLPAPLPDAPGANGKLAGAFEVGSSGEATYTLPFELPAGPTGMQPAIGLEYRSGGGDGLVGKGFSLTGFSTIARCPQTISWNDRVEPIEFSRYDWLCMDGMRLYPGKDQGTYAEFYTMPQTFVKIVGQRASALDPYGFDSFYVITKDGRRIDYGGDTASKVLSARTKWTGENIISAWLMNKVSAPTTSATITYNYVNYIDSTKGNTREYAPDSISYAGRTVYFHYQPKALADRRDLYAQNARLTNTLELDRVKVTAPGGVVARDYSLSYTLGPRTGRTRLTDVQECAANGACKPATHFDYQSSGEQAPLWNENVLPLPYPNAGDATTVMTMDVTGDGLDDVVTADSVPWSSTTTELSVAPNIGRAPFFNAPTAAFEVPMTHPGGVKGVERGAAIDYDQDGLQDLLLWDVEGQLATWHVLHTVRTATNAVTFVDVDTQIPRPFKGAVPKRLADANGSAHLADVNADGVADLIQCHTAADAIGLWVWQVFYWHPANANGPAGFDPTPVSMETSTLSLLGFPCDVPVSTVDIDHDGRVDLVMPEIQLQSVTGAFQATGHYFAASTHAGTSNYLQDTSWYVQKLWLPVQPPLGQIAFVDINGDGLPDAVESGYAANNLSVFMNTGEGFTTGVDAFLPAPLFSFDASLSNATVIDANGDGQQDLLVPFTVLPANGGHPEWTLLRASHVAGGPPFVIADPGIPTQVTYYPDVATLSDPRAPRVTDLDGDGAADILVFASGQYRVYRSTLANEDLLIGVTDGMNARQPGDPAFLRNVSLTYGNIVDTAITDGAVETDAAAQERTYLSRANGSNSCIYPRRCAVGARRVVKTYTLNNGADQPRNFEMRYRDGRFDRLGGGWLGFATRITLDKDTGAGKQETYDNMFSSVYLWPHYPFLGVVATERSWFPALPTDADPKRVDVRVVTTERAAHGVTTNGIAGYFAEVTKLTTGVYQASFAGQGGALLAWIQNAEQAPGTSTVSFTTDTRKHDDYGNETFAATHTDGVQYDLSTRRVFYNDPTNWIVGRLVSKEECSEGGGQSEQCRTEDITLDPWLGRPLTRTIGSTDGTQTQLKLTYAYDNSNNVTGITGEDTFGTSRTACATYDQFGVFPYAVRDPAGHTTYTAYDARFDTPTAEMDPNGRVTRWGLDVFGRVMKVLRPDGTTTTATLSSVQDPAHGRELEVRVQTTGGDDETTRFDQLGRQVIHWSANLQPCTGVCMPRVVTYTDYERNSSAVAQTSVPANESVAHNAATWFKLTYDAAGRVTSTVAPWVGGDTASYHYDQREVTAYEIGGAKRTIDLDARGRVVTVADAAGTTRYHYAAFDQLVQIDAPGNAKTIVFRDAFLRPVYAIQPDRGISTWSYDGFGQVQSSQDGAGRKATYIYDAAGRPMQREDADGVTTWHWDSAAYGIGALAEITTAASTASPLSSRRAFTYTNLGQLATNTLYLGTEQFQTSYTYDTAGRVQRIDYPVAVGLGGFSVKQEYDTYGHLIRVADPATNTTRWQATKADDQGHIIGELFGNGVVTSRTFLPAKQRPETIQTSYGATVLQSLIYDWDARRNLKSRTDTLQAKTESFGYDQVDRLTCATFGTLTGPCATGVTYDEAGNITSKSDVGGYTYDPLDKPHAVRTVAGKKYDYDGAGNQISRPDATLTYTAANLPRLITPSTGGSIGYEYDGFRTKIRETTPDTTTVFANDLYERRTRTNGTVEHLYSVRSSERVVAVFTRTSAQTPKGTYLHTEHLGSPDVLTDATGAVIERRSYDAFGKRRSAQWGQPWSGGSSAIPHGFTGQLDDSIGLVDMKGRTYDPNLGRFLQADPIVSSPGLGQDWNSYSYVRNNPLTLIDPSGFTSLDPVNVAAPAPSLPPIFTKIAEMTFASNDQTSQSTNVAQPASQDPDAGAQTVPKDTASTGTTEFTYDVADPQYDLLNSGSFKYEYRTGNVDPFETLPHDEGIDDFCPGPGPKSDGDRPEPSPSFQFNISFKGLTITLVIGGAALGAVAIGDVTLEGLEILETARELKAVLDEMNELHELGCELLDLDTDDFEMFWDDGTPHMAVEMSLGDRVHRNCKSTTAPAEGYELVYREDGFDMYGPHHAGDLFKYGETTRPNQRYSKRYLDKWKLSKTTVTNGTKAEMHSWQNKMIRAWKGMHGGERPPGNKSDY